MTTEFCTDYWIKQVEELELQLGNPPRNDFLSNKIIRHTMYADDPNPDWPSYQLDAVIKYFGYDETRELCNEPDFGRPVRKVYKSNYGEVISSHNNIQHLYHIVRWLESIHISGDDHINGVVEWGGGFGNMARLFKNIFNINNYSIIDLPYMNVIQNAYFDSIGIEVFTTSNPNDVLDLPSDSLFLSTWALSECNEGAIQYVVDRDFFKAHHLLLAAQQPDERFKNAGDLKSAASRCFFDPIVSEFRSGHNDVYLFQ